MNATQRKQLKAMAHSLKPVVMIGQSGLTSQVISEINCALDCHELIKIKIRAEREDRKHIQEQIATQTGAEIIQNIGQVAVVYRMNPKKH